MSIALHSYSGGVYVNFCDSCTDNTHIYGNVGTHRVLPSSLMPGKAHSQPLSSNDIQKHFGAGDDRRREHDERAIYQEALQVAIFNIILIFTLSSALRVSDFIK